MTRDADTAERDAKDLEKRVAEGDPFTLFGEWLALAEQKEPNDPNAMAIATAGSDGLPDVRMVLLKGFDTAGFVFYTNTESQKGVELSQNMQAAGVLQRLLAVPDHLVLLTLAHPRGQLVRVHETL